MSKKWNADELFSIRSPNVNRYRRNFLRQAVCELRFPTLMVLGERKPPITLVSLLRKEYPYVEQAQEFAVTHMGGPSESTFSHVFRSSKASWSITFKTNAIVVETAKYVEFSQLRDRVLRVVELSKELIDTDFFTRVGLRYVNVVPIKGDVESWLNPKLVGTLIGTSLKGVREQAGKLGLAADDGGCLLQHGLQFKPDQRDEATIAPDYVIDVDSYRNEVALEVLGDALDSIHSQGFDVFDWSLGDRSREYLSVDERKSIK